jgi:hypothetical protein
VSYMGEGPLSRFKRTKHPVARDEGLLVEQVADETVIYDEKVNQAHCLSPLAAVVFRHCDGKTTIQELGILASDRLGEPVDELRVIDALEQLSERDLLAVPPRSGISRREMVQKTAVTAGGVAFAAPLITSIMAPVSVAAASATCGELLCCACCQESSLNKEQCCQSPLTVTVNCQCVGNRDQIPAIKDAKYCKPGGSSAPDDDYCETLYGDPPGGSAGRQAHCLSFQTHGSFVDDKGKTQPAGGGAACNTCVVPS